MLLPMILFIIMMIILKNNKYSPPRPGSGWPRTAGWTTRAGGGTGGARVGPRRPRPPAPAPNSVII